MCFNYLLIALPIDVFCTISISFAIADDIAGLWGKFSLSDLEGTKLDVGKDVLPNRTNILVGRFVLKKLIGAQELGAALKQIWRLNSPLKVSSVDDGVFVFEFGNSNDCNRILLRQP